MLQTNSVALQLALLPFSIQSKIVAPNESECWLYTGPKNPEGYGLFHDVRFKGTRPPHRVVYEALVGPIPQKLVIDHLCRVKLCVNPLHLEPVTDKVNILRGNCPAAQNARKTHCKYGHPLSGDNLYTSPKRRRQCRICLRAKRARRRIRQRQCPTV